MAQSPWRSLRTLIPNTIAYYPTKQDFEGTGGVGTAAPVDNTKPFQPWRDNQAHYPNSSWFGGGPSMVKYTTFATHKDTGALQLHAIDSTGFLETYSLTVINVYREYRHLFTKGIPVLTPLILSAQSAAEFNYGYNGTFTPPPRLHQHQHHARPWTGRRVDGHRLSEMAGNPADGCCSYRRTKGCKSCGDWNQPEHFGEG